MSENEATQASEELIQFFLPHLTQYIKSLTEVFARVENKDFSEAKWLLIFSDKQSGAFLKHHYLSESWEELDRYLKRKGKLYYFLEEKQQGLVAQSFTFWLFFSPATAADYFKSQVDRPKNFSAQAIRPMPFPDFKDAFLDTFTAMMGDEEISNWQKIEKTADILKNSDIYLQPESVKEVDQFIKRKVIKYMSPEIVLLQDEIFKPGVSPKILERRLRSVLRIGWRYFRAKNELETKYFRKLLAPSAEERIKGLKLAKKKLIDFELDMAE